MDVGESQIVEIVDRVWSSLGLSFDRISDASFKAQHTVTGVVQITGPWQGAATLRCTSEMASQIAGAMFGVEPGASSPDEVHDALGEIVNMIAGNFKSSLPAGCQLSLPAVVEGRDYHVVVPGSFSLISLAFTSFNQPFQVGLLERNH